MITIISIDYNSRLRCQTEVGPPIHHVSSESRYGDESYIKLDFKVLQSRHRHREVTTQGIRIVTKDLFYT